MGGLRGLGRLRRVGVRAAPAIMRRVGQVRQVGVRAARTIMRRVGQVRQMGVRAARAIMRQVGQVGCKKEIFICGLKNNPYLCRCLNQ